MRFTDLGLPMAAGHGIWSATQAVANSDWEGAESVLASAAQDRVNDTSQRTPGGYHVFRDNERQALTLSLMKGA